MKPQRAFSYQPLVGSPHEGFETRLIYLHPGSFDDHIYCTIYHAPISEKMPKPEYTALSYVWGSAAQKQSLQLGYQHLPTNGTARTWPPYTSSLGADCYNAFPVTNNLEKALRHLRDPTSGRTLWVDAICINQSDQKEVLSQVQRMHFVYKWAIRVRIWLGSVSDVHVSTTNTQEKPANHQSRHELVPRGSYHLLSSEEDIGTASSNEEIVIERALVAAVDYVVNEDRMRDQEAKGDCFPDELQAFGIRIIAMQPWWRRVWVIQEATLPKDDPVMQCGYTQFGYRRFLEVAKNCILQDTPSILSRTHISLVVHRMFHHGYEPSKTSLSSRLLTYLSCMSGNFEVSKSKDRINGVFGRLNMGRCHDNILIFTMIDQDAHEDAVFFHQIAVWILFDPLPQSYPLRILESGPSNMEGIPSWVPMWESKQWIGESKNHGAPESDYDILAQGTSMGKIYRQSSILICDKCTRQYKKKWGAPKSLFDIDVRCTELRIQKALALGRVITTVEVLPLRETQDPDVLREAVFEVERRVTTALRSVHISHAEAKAHTRKFRDYLRLNFWDADSENILSSSEDSVALEDFLRQGKKPRKRETQQHGRRTSAHQANTSVPSSSSIAKLSSFFEHGRDLVVGSKIVGHMFEDSLPPWRCGDKLYLIPECRWALGLRRSGSAYRYMYRVFISDLDWQQRKMMFDGKGIYESILLA
jgi:hypothetical protein